MYDKLPISLIEIIEFRHSRSDIKSLTRANKNDIIGTIVNNKIFIISAGETAAQVAARDHQAAKDT